MQTYMTWDGKREIKVTFSLTGPPRRRGQGWNSPEANVKRTFTPSDELHSAIFSQDNGVLNDKTAPAMTIRERSSWLHLWDAVCCESVSPMEAYDAISLGYVPEHLTVRASNYMHHL